MFLSLSEEKKAREKEGKKIRQGQSVPYFKRKGKRKEGNAEVILNAAITAATTTNRVALLHSPLPGVNQLRGKEI